MRIEWSIDVAARLCLCYLVNINYTKLPTNAAGSRFLSPHRTTGLTPRKMSDFTQVPALLLYAVNSLTLKALITSSSESSVRQIAWLQAVVWASLGIWRCAQRREVLRSVARQVSVASFARRGRLLMSFGVQPRHTVVGGLLLFAQSCSCIFALQHHNFAR